ncbi:MAG: sulfur carrier protein ThiS adenylyltransferase ThiF [Bacteroidota bacterium]|nr:sulfur carrier protein ThiS adenylyltransferase ThiF [Bacteroidota bacterium]
MTFKEIKNILKTKKVGIAGAGGLGSNCAVALARVGVGTLIVADFDVLSEDNLNRQYYFLDQVGKKKVVMLAENIQNINPDVKVIACDVTLTEENIPVLFRDCDVIVEAFDRADQKKVLLETVISCMPDKKLVAGVGVAGWGHNETIRFRKTGNIIICGDENTEVGPDMPPMAPRVGIVANMEANAVMEILLADECVS